MDVHECKCKCKEKEYIDASVQTEFEPYYSTVYNKEEFLTNQHPRYFPHKPSDNNSHYELVQTILNQKKVITLQKTKLFGITYFKFGNMFYYYKPFQRLFKPKYNEETDMEEFLTKHHPPFSNGKSCIFISLYTIVVVFLSLITYVAFTFDINKYIRLCEIICFALLLILMLCTFFLNPDVVLVHDNIANITKDNVHNYRICFHCKLITLKQRNVFHCKECNVCFEKRDHHCDIFGKCITHKNKVLFYSNLACGVASMACIYISAIFFIIKLFAY